MSAFKDYLSYDLDNVFFNIDEFAEPHNVNGQSMDIIIDDDELKERQQNRNKFLEDPQGVYNADVLFYVKKSDFGEKPEVMENLWLDNELYQVVDAVENNGVLEITLMGRYS